MAMKLTKRKGFNFFRSYFDVYNELTDKEKVMFIDALLDRQFLGIKPKNLTGNARFAYISQTNSIDSQVKGFEDKTGINLTPIEPPSVPPTDGGYIPPTVQVEGKGKVKEEVQVKEQLPFFSDAFELAWSEWCEHRNQLKKKLTPKTKEMQLRTLGAKTELEAINMINQSIGNGWTGLFELKQQNNGKSKNGTGKADLGKLASLINAKYGIEGAAE